MHVDPPPQIRAYDASWISLIWYNLLFVCIDLCVVPLSCFLFCVYYLCHYSLELVHSYCMVRAVVTARFSLGFDREPRDKLLEESTIFWRKTKAVLVKVVPE